SIGVPTPHAFQEEGLPPAVVQTTFMGSNHPAFGLPDSVMDHHLVVRAGPAPGEQVVDTIFRGRKVVRCTFEVPQAAVGASLPLQFQVLNDLPGPPDGYVDQQAYSHSVVRYARSFGMGSTNTLRTALPHDALDKAHIGFAIPMEPVIYAYGDTVRRVQAVLSGGKWRALVPRAPTGDETEIFVVRSNLVTVVPEPLVPVNGTGYFTDFAALDVDSAMLIVTHASLMGEAMLYAQYREQHPRNRYNTLVADVDELYDQFAGGVPKHAHAVRGFCAFLLDAWSTDPQALFLIGKSVQAPSIPGSQGYRPDQGGAYARCLVPSYGWPVSDACLTMGLKGDPRMLDIPVGRLSASGPGQVQAYLQKVAAQEANPPAAWMKNILHFRGGNVDEAPLFAYYLNGYKQVAEDTLFGGQVIDFAKTSSDVLQTATADSVRQFIEQGVTLMTFVAHGFSAGFEITIDDPANYEWGGRHPVVVGNSCYSGNIHMNQGLSNSEDWVLMPGKGPVAFLASSNLGLLHYMAPYTHYFYQSFAALNHGQSIGRHMQHAGFAQLAIGSTDLSRINNVHTFTLEGDPTLILNSWPEPDYSIEQQDVLFEPPVITAEVDTFRVKAVVRNLGKAIHTGFNVTMQRTAPGLPAADPQVVALQNVHVADTATFVFPTLAQSGGQGPNQFHVRVDLDPDEVPELVDTLNNMATASAFIVSGDLVPVYPYDFAITPDPAPPLKASTGDPLAAPRAYRFQIDTTDLFNSPMLEQAVITAPGGVVEWQPQTIYGLNSMADSTVFFWRCSPDSTDADGYTWYERSFQHITDRHGWGQAHFFQFEDDHYHGMVHDRDQRRFAFTEGDHSLQAYAQGDPGGGAGLATRWFLDLELQDYGTGCGAAPAWHVAVLDPALDTWYTYHAEQNPDGFQFGNINNNTNCRNRPEAFFSFRAAFPAELAGMADMLSNGIPDGHHVLVYTYRYMDRHSTALNGPEALAAMEALGVPGFASMPDSVPYIFYVKKGDPASFQQVIGDTITAYINLNVELPGLQGSGRITTMRAGPMAAWHALHWNAFAGNPEDSTRIELIGVTGAGAEVPLGNWPVPMDSVTDLATIAPAEVYPWLRIRGYFHDTLPVAPDPAQMDRWQLIASPLPECAIHPALVYHNGLNGLQEPQEATFAVAVQNISDFDMDSLLMAAWAIDVNNVRHGFHYRLNGPLPAGAVLVDTIRFSTMGFAGLSTLIVEANPVDSTTGTYHQAEMYRFNNILQVQFDVQRDEHNPILDVTFDGLHIMDGDIVSARPEVLITLDDENPYLLLDSPADTANFRVYLSGPQTPHHRVYFRHADGTENMQFVPATGPENTCWVHYRPVLAHDGTYTLTVQAHDLSMNQSGDNDYKVQFEVINRPTITEVLNYPNPFTTNTRFIFTITGTEAPTYMKVQIMTVAGRVVREVGMHELGPLRVGRNISEFAWDGTDQFGDRLARGVYIYRVIAQLHGQDIEYRSTSASPYFHKGFGKMYLLR
ncbi:MAG: C25 family cysteine peptidase, partial [Flavobacteriales bacterium]|nr:C25 family cysteine peptidase [Flavobacteriales bacterium]